MRLETECPKCKVQLDLRHPSFDLNSRFICRACRHAAKLGEFLTSASKERILKATQEDLSTPRSQEVMTPKSR
jgi:hypothetical protein